MYGCMQSGLVSRMYSIVELAPLVSCPALQRRNHRRRLGVRDRSQDLLVSFGQCFTGGSLQSHHHSV